MPYQVIERVPLEVYEHQSYESAADYVDGEVRERCCGLKPHARMLTVLICLLSKQEADRKMYVLPLLSVRVAPTRVRIAEVCVMAGDLRLDELDELPPLLCVEVWQEDDTWEDQRERVRDFLAMGVKSVWLIDPYAERAFVATPSGELVEETEELVVAECDLRLKVKDLFTEARWD